MTRLSWAEARHRAATAAAPLGAERVALDGALGAVTAAPVTALAAVPAYDTAAMDGYAVAGPTPWQVRGRVLAGDARPRAPLSPGEAVEVATGAPVPGGTEAVLPYERAARDRESVTGEALPGRHVRRTGEDCPAGACVVAAGTLVTPTVAGLAASVGHDTLEVVRRPQVQVLVTGDEVVTAGLPGPGRVRDALGPVLPAAVRWAGGVPTTTTHLDDARGTLTDHLATASEDVVVVCGGAAATGPADHVRPALAALGADVRVAGVACRPGHPQLLARIPGGPWVVGLPGNPYAALVATLTLLAPLLGRLAGRGEPRPLWATTAGAVDSHPTDTRLVAARRAGAAVQPVGHDRPGTLWGAALADVLAVVPPGWCGGPVELLPLPGHDTGTRWEDTPRP